MRLKNPPLSLFVALFLLHQISLSVSCPKYMTLHTGICLFELKSTVERDLYLQRQIFFYANVFGYDS